VTDFKKQLKKYNGYHVVGIDGDDANLPPKSDFLNKGYKGYPIDSDFETHYLKMYTVRCVDLFSSVVLDFKESAKNDEISLALGIIENLPKDTISIYDRLYLSERLIDGHIAHNSFFMARCKSGSTFKEIVAFVKSKKKRSHFFYKGSKIHLIKKKNKKGELITIATNICISDWSDEELVNLYSLRWDVETSNRDSTSTLKLDQWHSEFHNGIMQEIYVHLILLNLTKISIYLEGGYDIDLSTNLTIKSNFKFIYSLVQDAIYETIKNGISFLLDLLRFDIVRTKTKRKRRSRSYPRVVKRKGKGYKNASKVPKRT